MRKHHDPKSYPWDGIALMATSAYNFFPNQHSSESAFFLMFGQDPITPLNHIIRAKLRYLGDEHGLLALDVLRQCYSLAACNIKMARDCNPDLLGKPPDGPLRVGDPVIIKNHMRDTFDPKFLVEYRIVSFPSERQVEVVSPAGKTQVMSILDVHY